MRYKPKVTVEKNRLSTSAKSSELVAAKETATQTISECLEMLKEDGCVEATIGEIDQDALTTNKSKLANSPVETLKLRIVIVQRLIDEKFLDRSDSLDVPLLTATLKLVDVDPFLSEHPDMRKVDAVQHLDTVLSHRNSWGNLCTARARVAQHTHTQSQ